MKVRSTVLTAPTHHHEERTVPYVITTTTPIYDLDHRPVYRPAREDVTRRAVATLDGAREIVHDIFASTYANLPLDAEWAARADQADDIFAHDGAGHGTIGPLADGTTVTVEQVDAFDLGARAGLIPADHAQMWPIDRLCDRFNAAQSEPASV
jgi:hypothetical protein